MDAWTGLRHHPQGYLELSTEYLRLSAWKEAGAVLDRGIAVAQSSGQAVYPLLLYYRAYVADQEENKELGQTVGGPGPSPGARDRYFSLPF